MLEMIVNPTPAPQPITWNYAELKAELSEALKVYGAKVYTEADITEAKKDRATLNNLKTVLNDERIRREKEYMEPFATFKGQVKELCDLIDEASQTIGKQLDDMEERRVKEKRVSIELEYNTLVFTIMGMPEVPDWLKLERVFDKKWLNKTFTMAKVKEAITEILNGIVTDMETLKSMGEYEAVEYYKTNLDLNLAIRESRDVKEMRAKAEEAKRKEEAKPAPVAKPTTEVGRWIGFKAYLTEDQATKLSKFCVDNGIKILPIKEV